MADGWAEVTIGDIADINPERTPKWANDRVVRYIDLSCVTAESGIVLDSVASYPFGDAPGRARRRVRKGDVLVSTVRPYRRGFAQVPGELDGHVASTGFAVLRAKAGVVMPGFIWCVVQMPDFADRLMELATGSNYPAVRSDDIAIQPVLLPPIAEQQRIVDLIAAVDESAAASRIVSSACRAAGNAWRADWFSRHLADSVPLAEAVQVTNGRLRSPKNASGPHMKR